MVRLFILLTSVEVLMLGDLARQSGRGPEAVDADCDDAQQKPLDPASEESNPCSGEVDAPSKDERVLRFPAIPHAHSPRIGDAESQGGEDRGQDAGGEVAAPPSNLNGTAYGSKPRSAPGSG